MEQYLLPIFMLVVSFNLFGVGHRVTNIIGGICGIIAAVFMLI